MAENLFERKIEAWREVAKSKDPVALRIALIEVINELDEIVKYVLGQAPDPSVEEPEWHFDKEEEPDWLSQLPDAGDNVPQTAE